MAGKNSLYLNDKLIAEHAVDAKDCVPITFGPAWIGSWNGATVSPADNRTFEGRMDELMIFNTALPAEEITRLFEDGLGKELASQPRKVDEEQPTETPPTTEKEEAAGN